MGSHMRVVGPALALVPVFLVGCGAGGGTHGDGFYDAGPHFPLDLGMRGSDGGAPSDMGLPPEVEQPVDFGAPASGERSGRRWDRSSSWRATSLRRPRRCQFLTGTPSTPRQRAAQ